MLYVRAFATIYNPVLAVRVLKLIKKEYPNVKLCMVGPDRDGSLALVEKEVNKLNLEKNIHFTGVLPKEDWHKISKDYDVFINTTNIDNTPVSLIEAMALGLPIVSTNVGGIPYLMNNGKNATLVDPNDEKLMANAILELLQNNSKTNMFSREGRIKAESMDWEVVKEKWFEILK